MITKYFKSVILQVPPVGHAAKMGRIFLANLPPRARSDIKIDFKLLNTQSDKPELKVTYKDGTALSANISDISTSELLETFDRQSRKLQLQDTIKE